jgi:hypothetical protein
MSVVPTTSDVTHTLIEDLRELVAALDRRVPQLERAGETAIARDALRLRDEAVARLATLAQA